MKENLGILSPIIWFILLIAVAVIMFTIALVYFVASFVFKKVKINKFAIPKMQFAR